MIRSLSAASVALSLLLLPEAAGAAGKPDLRASAVSAPQSATAPGSSVRLTARVANAGRAKAPRSVVRFRLSADKRRSASDPVVARVRARRLAAGRAQRIAVQAPLSGNLTPGDYHVLACADDTRRVREAREGNNCRATSRLLAIRAAAATPLPGAPLALITEPPPAIPESPLEPSPAPAPAPTPTPTPSPAPALPPDADADGTPDAEDCKPADPKVHPGAADLPDVDFVDANCDGIDGDKAKAVFVAKNGTGNGTMAAPYGKITLAIAAASQQPRRPVLVAAGTYNEDLYLQNGVGIYGGYYPQYSWQRSLSTTNTVIVGSPMNGDVDTILANNISEPTTLQGLNVQAPPAPPGGGDSIAIRALKSPGLRLESIIAWAGKGSAGIPLAKGSDGVRGLDGGAGGQGSCDTGTVGGKGGAGGASAAGNWGGAGGQGGGEADRDGFDGAIGLPATPGGPGGEDDNFTGHTGLPGTEGKAGDPGDPGDPGVNGKIVDWNWATASGQNGTNGTPGHGGGGGGGGGMQYGGWAIDNGPGNGGGGGGGGGTAGWGGKGGEGGGASIAVLAILSGGMQITDSSLIASSGGDGAMGSPGGAGGAGGIGGPGGEVCTNEVGAGGRGGNGGRGGDGGDGGGGAGGPSIAVLSSGGTVSVTNGSLSHGLGGVGGASPDGPSGAAGLAANQLNL